MPRVSLWLSCHDCRILHAVRQLDLGVSHSNSHVEYVGAIARGCDVRRLHSSGVIGCGPRLPCPAEMRDACAPMSLHRLSICKESVNTVASIWPVFLESLCTPYATCRSCSLGGTMASQMLSKRLVSGIRNYPRCIRRFTAAPRVCNRVSKLAKAAATDAPPLAEVITGEPSNNVTENIYNKIGVNLHKQPAHPLNIIREAIYEHFDKNQSGEFKKFDNLYPIVSTQANFDSVLVPSDHVSRSYNDTYYVSEDKVLRCSPLSHGYRLVTHTEVTSLQALPSTVSKQ